MWGGIISSPAAALEFKEFLKQEQLDKLFEVRHADSGRILEIIKQDHPDVVLNFNMFVNHFIGLSIERISKEKQPFLIKDPWMLKDSTEAQYGMAPQYFKQIIQFLGKKQRVQINWQIG